ncbi:MAG TPA: tetratricopeptide repeat protein [Pyrinomonadaceae bacterium]|jgi:tetratricopeptide (TPR) repeat protein
MATKSINLNTAAARAAIPLLAVLCVAFGYFFAKWFLANTIAARSVYKEIAALSVELAPADPQTHYASAVLLEKTFLPEDLTESLAEFEQAAALSPYDFRLWFDLGRARERAGDPAGAEKALRRAHELAPHYSQVQWALGNFLLRQGNETEAFALIRQAADGDKNFAGPAVASAWQLFQGELAKLRSYAGESVNLKAALALVLAKEKRFEDASDVWLSLPETARRTSFKANGEEIYQKMIEAHKYRSAVRMFRDIAGEEEKSFAPGTVTNGGFEASINPQNPGVFEWRIGAGVEPQIFVDKTQKRSGEISLVMLFNSNDGNAFRGISQTVAVEANKKYVFETFYKSDLTAGATFKWEIVDAASNDKVLASTQAVAANADWTGLKADFVVPSETEAVIIRLARVPCSATLCPIKGKLWFDDFSLN